MNRFGPFKCAKCSTEFYREEDHENHISWCLDWNTHEVVPVNPTHAYDRHEDWAWMVPLGNKKGE